ncbi:basic proline-rich protein-like [Choloepus didactylus]|uniref:basic proline-rich protein-like n=1 Tax=Choloepus didactylus TaxID=27675 RepID=UPI0018A0B1D2|nr:basic proline-rich protein-like [Choloepus didactylus]
MREAMVSAMGGAAPQICPAPQEQRGQDWRDSMRIRDSDLSSLSVPGSQRVLTWDACVYTLTQGPGKKRGVPDLPGTLTPGPSGSAWEEAFGAGGWEQPADHRSCHQGISPPEVGPQSTEHSSMYGPVRKAAPSPGQTPRGAWTPQSQWWAQTEAAPRPFAPYLMATAPPEDARRLSGDPPPPFRVSPLANDPRQPQVAEPLPLGRVRGQQQSGVGEGSVGGATQSVSHPSLGAFRPGILGALSPSVQLPPTQPRCRRRELGQWALGPWDPGVRSGGPPWPGASGPIKDTPQGSTGPAPCGDLGPRHVQVRVLGGGQRVTVARSALPGPTLGARTRAGGCVGVGGSGDPGPCLGLCGTLLSPKLWAVEHGGRRLPPPHSTSCQRLQPPLPENPQWAAPRDLPSEFHHLPLSASGTKLPGLLPSTPLPCSLADTFRGQPTTRAGAPGHGVLSHLPQPRHPPLPWPSLGRAPPLEPPRASPACPSQSPPQQGSRSPAKRGPSVHPTDHCPAKKAAKYWDTLRPGEPRRCRVCEGRHEGPGSTCLRAGAHRRREAGLGAPGAGMGVNAQQGQGLWPGDRKVLPFGDVQHPQRNAPRQGTEQGRRLEAAPGGSSVSPLSRGQRVPSRPLSPRPPTLPASFCPSPPSLVSGPEVRPCAVKSPLVGPRSCRAPTRGHSTATHSIRRPGVPDLRLSRAARGTSSAASLEFCGNVPGSWVLGWSKHWVQPRRVLTVFRSTRAHGHTATVDGHPCASSSAPGSA